MQSKRNRMIWLLGCALAFLFIVYAVCFCYLNIVKLSEHADSDTAAEVLLAREIWEQKDLSPDNWASSTERRIVSAATIGAFFYGMGVPMNLAMGIASVVCGVAVLAGFIYLLRTVKIGTLGTIVSCLLLLCLPVNGAERDGMLPFFTYLLFLFADYYAPHVVAMLFGTAVYFRLRRGEKSVFLVITGVFVAALVLALGASGMRCFQVVTAPMLMLEFLECCKQMKLFQNKMPRKRWPATGYVLCILLCNIAGMLYPSSVAQKIFLLSSGEIVDKLVLEIPAALLQCMGISGQVALKSTQGFTYLCVFLWIGITIFAYIQITKSKKDSEIHLLLNYYLLSLMFTVFILAISSIPAYHYYLFVVFFFMAATVGGAVDALKQKLRIPVMALLIWIALYAVFNLIYTYIPAVTSVERQKDELEVVEYMRENDFTYGYAQFWNANRITIVSEGDITMGGVYDMCEPGAYYWLTNTNWYVPVLPEDMKTAYVVTYEEREGFLQKAGTRAKMQEVFSNDKYIIYSSDKNLVCK